MSRSSAPHRTRALLPLLLLLPACFETGEDLTLPTLDATLVGRVEEIIPPPQDEPPSEPPRADSVEAVSITSSGTATVVAGASVQADGTYRLTPVPERQTNIQVVAYTNVGVEVGRAPFHGETRAEAEHEMVPITPESTVEAHVLLTLRAEGLGAQADDRGSLALLVHMDSQEAAAVAASETELSATAEGFAASRAYVEASAAVVAPDLTATVLAELAAELAADEAEARHRGATAAEAHDQLAEDVLDGWTGVGADGRALVSVTAARGEGVAGGSAGGSEPTRVALLRQAADLNLRARQRLAAAVDAGPAGGGEAVASALAEGRVAVAAAADLGALTAAIAAASTEAAEALSSAVLAAIGSLEPTLQAEVEAALAAAGVAADLSVRLAAAGSAQDAADAVEVYADEVEAAVQALLELVPAAGLDAEAVASLMIAARGGFAAA